MARRIREPRLAPSLARPAGDGQGGDGRERGGLAEVAHQIGVADQLAIGALADVGHASEQRAIFRRLQGGRAARFHPGQERGAAGLLDVARGQGGIREVVGAHLALLGDLDAAAEGVARQGADGAVGGTAAAADRAASAVEDAEGDAVLAADFGGLALGGDDAHAAGEHAAALHGVRVADEELLDVAAAADVLPVARVGQERAQQGAGVRRDPRASRAAGRCRGRARCRAARRGAGPRARPSPSGSWR